MIRKKGRGGARKGAGRRRALTFGKQLLIGAVCEEIQRIKNEEKTLERYYKQPHALSVVKFQEIARLHRLPETNIQLVFEAVRDGLSKAQLSKPATGFIRIPSLRAMTRSEICNLVSDDCMRRGQLRATPRQVNDAWKKYEAFVNLSRPDGRAIAKRIEAGGPDGDQARREMIGNIASEADLLELEAEVAKWPLEE